ncbi:MAG: hypothetical protein IKH70_07200 [Stomatobaculum sp.]|nr:hypothetical protein [Stomatobaculum sp.]
MAGREKKYTRKKLDEEVERYFKSISRTAPVTEEVWTGSLDGHGHKIMETQDVTNDLGEVMMRREYMIPPTVSGLCQFLGIHRATWARYCDAELHPEFCDTTTRARGYMRAYLEEQLLTRKDVRGIIFDLQNNHGYAEKKEIELGTRAARAFGGGIPAEEREELLQMLREEAGKDDAEPGADGAGD